MGGLAAIPDTVQGHDASEAVAHAIHYGTANATACGAADHHKCVHTGIDQLGDEVGPEEDGGKALANNHICGVRSQGLNDLGSTAAGEIVILAKGRKYR